MHLFAKSKFLCCRHGINNLLESHDEVRKVYKESVGQIVQMARLSPKQTSSDGETKQPKHVVVSNTHLFYHPMADHIRLLQAYAICHKLDEVRRVGGNADPLIICGDFNSGPLSGEQCFGILRLCRFKLMY